MMELMNDLTGLSVLTLSLLEWRRGHPTATAVIVSPPSKDDGVRTSCIHNAARFGLLLLFEIKLLGNDPRKGGVLGGAVRGEKASYGVKLNYGRRLSSRR